jgi:hypothetical protein
MFFPLEIKFLQTEVKNKEKTKKIIKIIKKKIISHLFLSNSLLKYLIRLLYSKKSLFLYLIKEISNI